jgi:hypothetical protein
VRPRSIGFVLSHLPQFFKLALGWTAVVVAAVAAAAGLSAMDQEALDLAGAIATFQAREFRAYLLVTSLASIPAQMAIAIWSTRLALRSEMPRHYLSVPTGAARYFAYSFLVGAILILSLIPGAIAGQAIVGWLAQNDPETLRQLATEFGPLPLWGGAALTFMVAVYFCVRLWLVFPAIALGERMGLSRSFRLMRGSTFGVLGGTILALLPFLGLAVLSTFAFAEFTPGDPRDSGAAAAMILLAEAVDTLITYAWLMASAVFMAFAYREILAADAEPAG